MSIVVSRESESFTVEHSEPLVEAALAMVELNRRWGYSGNPSQLSIAHERIIASALKDPRTKFTDLKRMKQNSEKIELMEELAASFRAMEDEPDELRPRFDGTPNEAMGMLRDYAASLGCRVEVSL